MPAAPDVGAVRLYRNQNFSSCIFVILVPSPRRCQVSLRNMTGQYPPQRYLPSSRRCQEARRSTLLPQPPGWEPAPQKAASSTRQSPGQGTGQQAARPAHLCWRTGGRTSITPCAWLTLAQGNQHLLFLIAWKRSKIKEIPKPVQVLVL